MDCRTFVLSSAICFAMTGAGAVERAPVAIEVNGNDFPVLVQDTSAMPPPDGDGLPSTPGCEAIRAKRVDELPSPWREAVDRIHLDCQSLGEDEDDDAMIALNLTAYLKPGRVWLAGHPVREIRLMDSELWGDHQYVIAGRFDTVADDLRQWVETRCAQELLRDEMAHPQDCRMLSTDAELYLQKNEIGGVWVHADPDDPELTVYAEGWAD